jgi:TonB-dependent SusC/RagA subfamily outer membrane receptor
MKTRMLKTTLITLLAIFTTSLTYGQHVTVKGKVMGFKNCTLQNIVVKGSKSKSKVLTKEDGSFSIICLPDEALLFESKSFKKVKKKIKNPGDSIIVHLVFKDTPKSKEYAIAYGVMKEEELTYSISQMRQEKNNFAIYSNVYELIKGRFAGVEVSGKDVYIRGKASINADNCALFIVDGVTVADLSIINPNDIESIDVLKGASASIYGSRGANGVIIIKTRR